jgi:concentrative nucleoside transporter, CNT family
VIFDYFMQYNRYLNVVGIVLIFLIACIVSKNRRAINLRLAGGALVLHFIFAYLMLANPWGKVVVKGIADAASTLSIFAQAGIDFVFGQLGNANQPWGFIFAVKVVPVIIFVGALTALLFHWGIIQRIVYCINTLIRPLLGTSGIETTAAIANAILGQTEAALFMSNYLPLMTESELFVLMASGMAAISISVLVIYITLGLPAIHLLAASVMSIPASIFIAKIIIPETTVTGKADRVAFEPNQRTSNSFDAIAKGTIDGLTLAVNVIAMLISFLALLSMADYLLNLATIGINRVLTFMQIHNTIPELSIALIFSYIFAPFAYFLGFTGTELWQAGKLLGIKVSVNELVAFTHLMKTTFSDRSFIIAVYALCGFSNLSCIGIQIGMIGALAPKQRHHSTQLGLYAVLASSLANLLSAMVVGLLL